MLYTESKIRVNTWYITGHR